MTTPWIVVVTGDGAGDDDLIGPFHVEHLANEAAMLIMETWPKLSAEVHLSRSIGSYVQWREGWDR